MSVPFRFVLDLVSEDPAIDGSQLLGKAVGIEIDFGEEGEHTRHIGGIVSHFAQGERGWRFTRYQAEVVPQLWLTTLRHTSRIFQELKVDEILRKVLAGMDVKYELTGTYEPANFRVQYRETDFAFASRLMEEEGIFYFFTHAPGSHQLVIADVSQQVPVCPGPSPHLKVAESEFVPFSMMEPAAFSVVREEGVVPKKWTLWDHNFEMPGKNLEASAPVDVSIQKTMPESEVYDYPGEYAHRFDGISSSGGEQASRLQKILDDNRRVVGLRAREGASQQTVLRGESNYPFLTAGHVFALEGHYREEFNGEYVITSVTHHASEQAYEENNNRSAFSYRASFTAIPKSRPFAPPRITPRPRVHGAQTAVVVGPAGSEIFTDKYGRVKVQFNWDREGAKNDASSCWVRVATPWAGKTWGMISIPRIGNEVVVDFLEGDPDKPIITGMVYNASSMPPYVLPDNSTQTGLKTRSSPQGTPENFNEIRFEDKKDKEEIYIHAERDLNAVIENNETRKVGFEKKDKGDQSVEVFNNQTVKVGAGASNASDGSQSVTVYKDQTVVLEKGNQSVTLKEGNRTVTLDKGNETVQLKMGNRSVTLDKGNDALTIKTGNLTTKVDLGNVTLELTKGNIQTSTKMGKIAEEAMQGIELKVGQSSVKIDQAGVTIKGMKVQVEGAVQAVVKGVITEVSGDGLLKMKGGVTMIN